MFTTGGKFYTIGADRLPGGRGHGEPIRIIVDMENDQDIVTAFVHAAGRKLLIASHDGNGFIVPEAEVVANTRKGKQVMNVALARRGRRAASSVVGRSRRRRRREPQDAGLPARRRSRKWRAARACGCRNTRMAALLDIKTFDMASGLSWQDSADRTFVKSREELAEWIGARASAGRMAPKGFPRTGKFG